MKTKFAILMVLILMLAQACTAVGTDEASSPQNPAVPPTIADTPVQITPEVSTAVGGSGSPSQETPAPSEDNGIPAEGLTLDDNGKTFIMQVGDSVLLNLGTDAYEWEVSVDNQAVLHMKMGVMVIKGAQGIYDALAPGTAILSASGNPLCAQTQPACAMPSILFSVTIVVE